MAPGVSSVKDWELNWLLNSPAFNRTNATARQLRNENTASWMDEMLRRIVDPNSSVEDAKASTSATAGHSVESFVEDLRKRVGLDALGKLAAVDNPDHAAYNPHKHEADPQKQALEVQERFKLLAETLRDLLGNPSKQKPEPVDAGGKVLEPVPKRKQPLSQHVNQAAVALLELIGSKSPSNTYVHQQLVELDKVRANFVSKLPDSPEKFTPEETLVADVMMEVKHGLEVLARVATPDAMQGVASIHVPLRKTALDPPEEKPEIDKKKVLAEMVQFLKTYHLKPSHAMKQPEALFFELKEKFGTEVVQEIGRDQIMELIGQLKKEMKEPSMIEGLPEYDGSPIQLRDEPEEKPGQQKTLQR